MELITVSSRGQVVIPEKVRNRLHIKAGSKLVLIEREGNIFLRNAAEVEKHLAEEDSKETAGWPALAERSLHDVWDNPKDEKTWAKYL